MKPLSPEIRELLLKKIEEGATQCEVAEELNIGQSTVSTLMKQYQERSHLVPLKPGGKKSTYSDKDLKVLVKIIEDQPDKTMTEYAQLLGHKLNRPPMSQSNIQRIMAKLGFTRKKKSKYAKEQGTLEIKKKRRLSASP